MLCYHLILFFPLVIKSELIWLTNFENSLANCEGGSTHRYCGDKQATIYPELVGLEQEDPVLIKALKERVLIPPPPKEYVLNLQNEQLWNDLKGQFGQVDVIRQHGKDFGIDIKKRGFFIEAGASDGENISNTLYLEKKYNWKGLLVEPNPDFADGLIKKKRQAWILPHCLSIHNTSTIENFDNIAFWGGIINSNKNKMPGDIRKETTTEDYPSSYKRRLIKVQCFPLYSVLSALGQPTVDYLSLDIEGAELPVLKTVPWEKVNIRLIGVEVEHLGKIFDGNYKDLQDALKINGYNKMMPVGYDVFFWKDPNDRVH